MLYAKDNKIGFSLAFVQAEWWPIMIIFYYTYTVVNHLTFDRIRVENVVVRLIQRKHLRVETKCEGGASAKHCVLGKGKGRWGRKMHMMVVFFMLGNDRLYIIIFL